MLSDQEYLGKTLCILSYMLIFDAVYCAMCG